LVKAPFDKKLVESVFGPLIHSFATGVIARPFTAVFFPSFYIALSAQYAMAHLRTLARVHFESAWLVVC